MTVLADQMSTNDDVRADCALQVDGLTVDIRTIKGTVRAVNGVSFQAYRGETLALLGESGCGKSMTATALVGLLEPVAEITGGSGGTGRYRPVRRRQEEAARAGGHRNGNRVPGRAHRTQPGPPSCGANSPSCTGSTRAARAKRGPAQGRGD